MSLLRRIRRPLAALTVGFAVAISSSASLHAEDFPPQHPGQPQQAPQQVVFSGDGMTVVITQLDPNTGTLGGTVRIGQGQPMPFQMRVTTDAQGREIGQGQVRTPQGLQPITSVESGQTGANVTFGGRLYRLQMNAMPQTPGVPGNTPGIPNVPGNVPGNGPSVPGHGPNMPGHGPQHPGAGQMVLAGDGLVMTITGQNAQGMLVGTVRVGQGQPMALTMRLQPGQQGGMFGQGSVQTAQGAAPIQLRFSGNGPAVISLGGRTYRVMPQQAGQTPMPNNPPVVPGHGGQQLPANAIVFRGQGLTMIVTSNDGRGTMGGTIQLAQGQAMPFRLSLQQNAMGQIIGQGQIQTPQGAVPFTTQDRPNNQGSIVTIQGKQYLVGQVQPGQQPQQPVNPLDPNQPGQNPVNPFGPQQPGQNPVNPLDPNQPGRGPVNPLDPNQPGTNPVNPLNPNQPGTGPVNPLDPNQPQQPRNPVPQQPGQGGGNGMFR